MKLGQKLSKEETGVEAEAATVANLASNSFLRFLKKGKPSGFGGLFLWVT
jgi:hypothetical protein